MALKKFKRNQNQQKSKQLKKLLSKLSETEKAYLAGILDGEGSISLARSHARSSAKYVYPLVRIANTDKKLISWIRKRIPIGHAGYVSKIHKKCKDVYHVAWASTEAVCILQELLPYLVCKKFRAEVAIQVWLENEHAVKNYGQPFGNYHPVPAYLSQFREQAFNFMKYANRKGV